jgi:uncharacterized protein YndB with AHSA1/START domain
VKISDSTVCINASSEKVWRALTRPELVKQWQYGADLLTTWEVGSSIVFRNEWNGQVFEQKGKVLEFLPESRLKYSLFFPHAGMQDIAEHYFFMIYELTEQDGITSLLMRMEDPRPLPDNHSSDTDEGPNVLSDLKALVEVKMP